MRELLARGGVPLGVGGGGGRGAAAARRGGAYAVRLSNPRVVVGGVRCLEWVSLAP